MQLFTFLTDISPWWWIAFGIALGVVEMATMSFFLIWPALAAIAVGLFLIVDPSTSGEIQIAVFAILAVVLTFAGRYLLHRFGETDGASDNLNSRANLMVGRHAQVQEFIGPEGSVTVDGVRWHAVWQNGTSSKRGATVKIIGADGMSLLIEPED